MSMVAQRPAPGGNQIRFGQRPVVMTSSASRACQGKGSTPWTSSKNLPNSFAARLGSKSDSSINRNRLCVGEVEIFSVANARRAPQFIHFEKAQLCTVPLLARKCWMCQQCFYTREAGRSGPDRPRELSQMRGTSHANC